MDSLFDLDQYTEEQPEPKTHEWVIYYVHGNIEYYAWENKNRTSQYQNQWEWCTAIYLSHKRRKPRQWSRYQDADRAAKKFNQERTEDAIKKGIVARVKAYTNVT